MRDYYKWDKDAVLELASIFTSMVEFRKAYQGAYKFATRHGFLDEVRAIVTPTTTDVEELKRRVEMELDSSRRHFFTASKTRMIGTDLLEKETDIALGNYLDHDISHWEQAGEEREDRALDWIAQIAKHGSEGDIAEVWEQFRQHQEFGRQGNTERRSRRGINTRSQGGK